MSWKRFTLTFSVSKQNIMQLCTIRFFFILNSLEYSVALALNTHQTTRKKNQFLSLENLWSNPEPVCHEDTEDFVERKKNRQEAKHWKYNTDDGHTIFVCACLCLYHGSHSGFLSLSCHWFYNFQTIQPILFVRI